MKMKIKKIDLSGVKEYLFQKGERLGLAVCGALALLLLLMGLMKAGGSSTTYAKDLERARTEKQKQINQTGGDIDEGNKSKPNTTLPDPWPDLAVNFDFA